MKKTIKNIILLLAIVFGHSCSEDYLDTPNQNRLSESSFYITEQDFEDLIITAYMPLGFNSLYGIKAHFLNFAIDDRVAHEDVNVSTLQYTSTTGSIADVFTALYTGIFRCNLFFQKCTEDKDIPPSRRQTMLGEAYFLRGLYYLHLAVWFEVPPLLLEPPSDPAVGYPNATEEEIYNQVEEDFLRAVDLLPEEWDLSNTGRATSGAAMAFLGKAYLYQAKYQEAANTLKSLIDLDIYELSSPAGTDSLDYVHSYLANFSPIDLPGSIGNYMAEFNKESIFEVSFSTAHDEGDRSSQYLPLRRSTGSQQTWFNGYATLTGGYGNLSMETNNFPKEFEQPTEHPAGLHYDPRYYAVFIRPGDSLDWRPSVINYYLNPSVLGRATFHIADINSTLGSNMGMRKHIYPFHNKLVWNNYPFQDPNNWRLMRYADVLLMYAEAVFRSTGNANHPDGLDAINEVRERVGMPAVASLSKQAIMHERDIEMACEHSRFWDLARWYKNGWLTIDEVQAFLPTYQPRHVCFPIPQVEINRNNGVLKQNPKWE